MKITETQNQYRDFLTETTKAHQKRDGGRQLLQHLYPHPASWPWVLAPTQLPGPTSCYTLKEAAGDAHPTWESQLQSLAPGPQLAQGVWAMTLKLGDL